MNEVEEFLSSSRQLKDRIKSGLQSLNEEEEQLLQIRTQLKKVKKLKEEQVKKDELISTLQERLAILEFERTSANRQNSELHEIMSERIMTLERYIQEKDTIEKLHIQQILLLEQAQVEKEKLSDNILFEHLRNDETNRQLTKANEEINELKERIASEQKLNDQMQIYLDSARSEAKEKDEIIFKMREISTKKDHEASLELSQLKVVLDQLGNQLQESEESLKRSMLNEAQLLQELNSTKKELLVAKADIEGWTKLYQEAESILFKSSDASQQENKEKSELKVDLQHWKTEAKRLQQDLLHCKAAISDISKNFKSIQTKFDEKDDADFSKSTYESIMESLKDLRKITFELPVLSGCDFNQLVQFSTQMLGKVAQTRLNLSKFIQKTAVKLSPESAVPPSLGQLESAIESIVQDGKAADSIVSGILDEMERVGISTEKSSEEQSSVTTAAPHHAKPKDNGRQLEYFSSERRDLIYASLVVAVRACIDMAIQSRTNGNLIGYLNSCQEELAQLQEKYRKDVQALERLSDEAYMAVKVNVIESEKSHEQTKIDFQKRLNEEKSQHSHALQVFSASIANATSYINQLLVCIGHCMHHISNQQQQFASLKEAYSLTSKMAKGYRILQSDLKSLATMCQRSAGPGIGGLRDTGHSLRPRLRVVVLFILAANRLRTLPVKSKSERGVYVQGLVDMIEWQARPGTTDDSADTAALAQLRRVVQKLAALGFHPEGNLRKQKSSSVVNLLMAHFSNESEDSLRRSASQPSSSSSKTLLSAIVRADPGIFPRSNLPGISPGVSSAGTKVARQRSYELYSQRELNLIQSFLMISYSNQTIKNRRMDNFKEVVSTLEDEVSQLQRSLRETRAERDTLLAKLDRAHEILKKTASTAITSFSLTPNTSFHDISMNQDDRADSRGARDSFASAIRDERVDTSERWSKDWSVLESVEYEVRRNAKSLDNSVEYGTLGARDDSALADVSVSSRDSHQHAFAHILSARKGKVSEKDRELLEIYADIGRLTEKLEGRAR